MKKLLFTFLFCMLLTRAWGENYTIVIAPNGKTCRHINIENEKGEVIEITTKDEVKEPHADFDSEALTQVKAFFKNAASQSLLNSTVKTKVAIQKVEALDAERQ